MGLCSPTQNHWHLILRREALKGQTKWRLRKGGRKRVSVDRSPTKHKFVTLSCYSKEHLMRRLSQPTNRNVGARNRSSFQASVRSESQRELSTFQLHARAYDRKNHQTPFKPRKSCTFAFGTAYTGLLALHLSPYLTSSFTLIEAVVKAHSFEKAHP